MAFLKLWVMSFTYFRRAFTSFDLPFYLDGGIPGMLLPADGRLTPCNAISLSLFLLVSDSLLLRLLSKLQSLGLFLVLLVKVNICSGLEATLSSPRLKRNLLNLVLELE